MDLSTPTRLRLVRDDPRVLWVWLSRPDLRNAFDDVLVAEATEVFLAVADDPEVRAVVLAGDGKVFCAGADLNWMTRMVSYGLDENRRDANALAVMLRAINDCPKPVVGRIHGAALGGGIGLAAVCDIAITAEDTIFGTTEVRLGIIPAVISPYVVRKIGETNARVWFLTGERYSAEEAHRVGLVHMVVPETALNNAVLSTVEFMLAGGPEALAQAKSLAKTMGELPLDEAIPITVDRISGRRVSAEGQEGMKAFLEKRRPAWSARPKG